MNKTQKKTNRIMKIVVNKLKLFWENFQIFCEEISYIGGIDLGCGVEIKNFKFLGKINEDSDLAQEMEYNRKELLIKTDEPYWPSQEEIDR